MEKNITIVGNGFASLFFIVYFLAMPVSLFFTGFFRKVYSRYNITLIGNGRFVYFPAIPEFITRKKRHKDVVIDIRSFLRRRNIGFVNAQVTDIQDGGRTVITTKGTFTNDALFLGVGPSFQLDDIPGTKEFTYSPCCGPDEMDEFVQALEKLDSGIVYMGYKVNKKDGFVAGRGGQMYECACLLDYQLKKLGKRDNFDIHFFSPNIKAGETGAITDRLNERGIILDYGYEPAKFVKDGMVGHDDVHRKADLVLFSPGITAPNFVKNSCLPESPGGHIDVDKYGQVKGLKNVFAAGDCANHENPPKWVPHQAHMAQLRAQAAAKNMRLILKNRNPSANYRFELSCILNMENDAMWLHAASDGKPPFWNIFPSRSKKLIHVKNLFERVSLVFLRYF